jgi:signal transduction histidine kinase
MRLKIKLVLAITSLVFLIAGALSLVYVSQLLHQAVQQSWDTNLMVAQQVRLALQQALETGLKDRKVDPGNPAELRALAAIAVRDSEALQAVMESVNRYSLTVYDVNIGDAQSRGLLSTNPENEDRPLPVRSDYRQLLNANSLALMRTVFGPPRVFDVVVPLNRNGELFVSVHVGVRTTLLRAFYAPWLAESITLMAIALVTALLAAFLLGNLALQPMERISRQLDRLTQAAAGEPQNKIIARQDAVEQVSSKIELIGQRMRNVEEVFSALRENLDQILGNLKDGILLFTSDGRVALVSEVSRRFLHLDQEAILGRYAQEIFDRSTILGRLLLDAIEAGISLKEEVRTETGRRIQTSVDFIEDEESRQGLGALVTLHDLESAAEIESDLELSRRMAAIGRLTSGVGHEVKNPINAIVVHLELLKSKLGDAEAPAARHLDVIDAEIHRLDRVVQTLVDFSRPVDLDLREQDLRLVLADVLALATEELSTRNVTLSFQMPNEALIAHVDADMLKQAALNVIENGAQAMPEGGKLVVALHAEREPGTAGERPQGPRTAVISVADEGPGIAREIREKIFDLFFTTKVGGSGIGLAMTYRILQLHHGNVEVESREGGGTRFLLRIPLSGADRNRRTPLHAWTEAGKGP